MTSAYLLNLFRAHQMLCAGYINKIVLLESKLSIKTVRGIKATLRSEGVGDPSSERLLRSGYTIIRNASIRRDATLLMLIYRELTGERASQHSIQIDAIDQAYALYLAAKQELSKGFGVDVLSINDAYSLAKELRSCEADFTTCTKCHSEYFISDNQRSSESCPFCAKTAKKPSVQATALEFKQAG